LNSDQIYETSKLLTDLWIKGSIIEKLPEKNCPQNRKDAYKVQSFFKKLSAQPLFGWKAAATRASKKKLTKIEGPIAGCLLAERQLENHGTCSLKSNHMCVAEAEFAFKMDQDFLPRDKPYTIEEIISGVASLHPAIEIPNTRLGNFTDADAPQIIADNALAHEFIIGDHFEGWQDIDLAQQVVMGNTATHNRTGSGAMVMHDPRIALTWLVNELSLHSNKLEKGQIVLTGTCIDPVPVVPGDLFTANFGQLGSVSVKFST
jgi:2-keto-4-pentenoate hydratase